MKKAIGVFISKNRIQTIKRSKNKIIKHKSEEAENEETIKTNDSVSKILKTKEIKKIRKKQINAKINKKKKRLEKERCN